MTVLKVEIMLHYSFCGPDFPGIDKGLAKTAMDELIAAGIFTETDRPLATENESSNPVSRFDYDIKALQIYRMAVLTIPLPTKDRLQKMQLDLQDCMEI